MTKKYFTVSLDEDIIGSIKTKAKNNGMKISRIVEDSLKKDFSITESFTTQSIISSSTIPLTEPTTKLKFENFVKKPTINNILLLEQDEKKE